MKTIEVLYPLFNNIYADSYSIKYLSMCIPNVKVVYTNVGDEPYFAKHKVDLIYMGSVPDSKIEVIINELVKYKNKIKKLIEQNTIFLLTGNALETFSSYIKENNRTIEGLGIFDYYIIKDMNQKHSSWCYGKFLDMKIVGNRSQFSKCIGIKDHFIDVIGGVGSDLERLNEGIHYKNLYATYLLGPFLILNPPFTKHILKLLGCKTTLLQEKELMLAYNSRIQKFDRKGAHFLMGDHG